jgi:hypothetical protein
MYFSLLAFPVLAVGAALIPRNISTCSNPPTRIEWRSLPLEERTSYVNAVNCLATKPSRIGLGTSLYDDFPHIHNELDKRSMSPDHIYQNLSADFVFEKYIRLPHFCHGTDTSSTYMKLHCLTVGIMELQRKMPQNHSLITFSTTGQILGLDTRFLLPIPILDLGSRDRTRRQR